MSTRSSISYVGPVHIFREVLTDEICIEVYQDESKPNEIYGCPTLSLQELRSLVTDLDNYLKERNL